MTTSMLTNASQSKKWVQRVRDSLGTRGYYYEPEFDADTNHVEAVVATAKLLGCLHAPIGADPDQPVIRTRPTPSAPPWRPFDRHIPIRWHNDFSTRAGRPELSLSWVLREDPAGSHSGAWRVVSSFDVLTKLRQSSVGDRLIKELSDRAEPFGYRDAGGWRPFRVVIPANHRLGQSGLRFYGPALEDGAWLRFGGVPERTREIVERIEEAADSVCEVLPAKTGSLLIVHNSLSLHDRTPQTTAGPEGVRRQALLCFVKRFHPL